MRRGRLAGSVIGAARRTALHFTPLFLLALSALLVIGAAAGMGWLLVEWLDCTQAAGGAALCGAPLCLYGRCVVHEQERHATRMRLLRAHQHLIDMFEAVAGAALQAESLLPLPDQIKVDPAPRGDILRLDSIFDGVNARRIVALRRLGFLDCDDADGVHCDGWRTVTLRSGRLFVRIGVRPETLLVHEMAEKERATQIAHDALQRAAHMARTQPYGGTA